MNRLTINPTSHSHSSTHTQNKQSLMSSCSIINCDKLRDHLGWKEGKEGKEGKGRDVVRYRSVEVEDSVRRGMMHRFRNKTIQTQTSRHKLTHSHSHSHQHQHQHKSTTSIPHLTNHPTKPTPTPKPKHKQQNRTKQDSRTSSNKQTIVSEIRTYRHKSRTSHKSKIVNSARELYCYGELGHDQDTDINTTNNNYKTNTIINTNNNTTNNNNNHTNNNRSYRKPKKPRRYLTQIPSNPPAPNPNPHIKTEPQQQTTSQHQQIFSNELRQTPLRIELEQISEILQQTKYNTRDQMSILDSIGELDQMLGRVRGFQDHPTVSQDGFRKKSTNSIKKPTPIQTNLTNTNPTNHNHPNNHNKQNQQTQPQLKHPPSCQYHTIQSHECQQMVMQQQSSQRVINIYQNRSKKNRNKLKELRSHTLIMKSIDKIKHIFPRGFFYDTINQIL